MKEEQKSVEHTKSALETLETAPKVVKKDLSAELLTLKADLDKAYALINQLKAEQRGTMSPELEAKIAKQKERDKTPVTGFFRNIEAPGDKIKFIYKKYKGDPITEYELMDGDTITIPFGVAQHINDRGRIPEHRNQLDENGKPVARITSNRRRFVFSSTEFIIEPEADIATVSRY